MKKLATAYLQRGGEEVGDPTQPFPEKAPQKHKVEYNSKS
jgi:hypothetical protein